jgi:undecaprenyl diphosphate synthase
MNRKVPRHVAVIMDGNGRWAQQRGLPRLKGHEEGAKSIGACLEACRESGVEILTLYAFSAENWKRPPEEVRGLMSLLERFLRDRTREMEEKNIRLRTIGRIHKLPGSCQKLLQEAVERTRENSALTVVLALSYGGRDELVDAVRAIADKVKQGRLDPEEIGPDTLAAHLDTAGLPDPDLLIRTSGEMRLSNFLLWQLSYTEIYVTSTLWPDFRKEDFLDALAHYGIRNRRYGGV